jgi:antitoxin (DNA-binding transcriptional repressor) of toxin-antitoxin stability system
MNQSNKVIQRSLDEFKNNPQLILDSIESGDQVYVVHDGTILFTIQPYPHQLQKRTPGALAGKIWMSPDFNEYDKNIENLFYEENE